MRTELGLQYIENKDENFMYLLDTSVYNTDVPVDNPILRITPPNFNKYIDIPYKPSTIIRFNNDTLFADHSSNLSSGLYKIIQSVCPNDILQVTHYFFHRVKEYKQLAKMACYFREKGDEDGLLKIFELKMYLDEVQNLLDECECIDKAIELYNVVVKRISILDRDCNCGYK